MQEFSKTGWVLISDNLGGFFVDKISHVIVISQILEGAQCPRLHFAPSSIYGYITKQLPIFGRLAQKIVTLLVSLKLLHHSQTIYLYQTLLLVPLACVKKKGPPIACISTDMGTLLMSSMVSGYL